MNKVIFEILKSNLTKNSIEAIAENKRLKYSSMDCFEDCFNLGRAIAEEINKWNQQQQEQQHQAVVAGIINFFVNMYQKGPTNLTQAAAEDIILQICSVLGQAQNQFALEFAANCIQQNINNDFTLTATDRNNLCLFTNCCKIILNDRNARGLR